MFGIELITAYLLVVALATLLVAVLVWQTHRSGRTVIVWLAASVIGVVLGCIGWFAAERTLGYHWVKIAEESKGPTVGAPTGMPGMGGMGMGGMSKGGPPGMGGMGGMGGGMGGMGGMGPRPKRDLATLVRKLDLLTGDIAISLTADQAAAVNDCLKDVEKPAKMSDDEAKAKHDKLLAVINDAQKERLEAVGLPRPTGRAGGPGGPGMGGPGMGGPKGGMPGMGAPKQDEDQNPFQQEAEAKALKSLRERLAPKTGGDKPKAAAEAPQPAAEPPKAADKPKASPDAPKPGADKAPAKKP